MAKQHNTNQKAPALSLAQRFGSGAAAVASPETQPRETAIRNAGTGAALHKINKKSNSTGLKP